MKRKRTAAIILAAGRGERAGFARNKLLVPLYGAPALYHTLEKFDIPEIDEVTVTSSTFDFEEISALCAPFGYRVVTGGATRAESVELALKGVTCERVLIHDGARPFLSRELILRCIDDVDKYGSAVCSLPCPDTAAYCDGGAYTGLDRDKIRLMQTPQGFNTEDISRAYRLGAGDSFTDDGSLYAHYIAPPHMTEGERGNVKLTYREDFMRGYPPFNPTAGCDRAAFGADVHAFGKGDKVTLCGVKIPCDGALIAHSDGDVAAHAVIDALLSGAGLDDIGHYFPDTDSKYRGADSMLLLARVTELIKEAGYSAINISLSIQAEKPRLAAHIDEMRKNLSRVTGVPAEAVAIAAGTCEGLGFVGRGQGIAAYCAAGLSRIEKEG